MAQKMIGNPMAKMAPPIISDRGMVLMSSIAAFIVKLPDGFDEHHARLRR